MDSISPPTWISTPIGGLALFPAEKGSDNLTERLIILQHSRESEQSKVAVRCNVISHVVVIMIIRNALQKDSLAPVADLGGDDNWVYCHLQRLQPPGIVYFHLHQRFARITAACYGCLSNCIHCLQHCNLGYSI